MSGAPWLAMIAGCISVALSLVYYNVLFYRSREELSGYAFREIVAQLISHLPDDDSPAWPHIACGVALTLGLSLVGGFFLEAVAVHFDERVPTSTGATLAGVIFSAEIGAISFWTLWQTKRIERGQGQIIHDFGALTFLMNREMRKLWGELKKNGWKSSTNHRFLLITNNPWLGMLSDPEGSQTIEFKENLLRLASAVPLCKQKGQMFRFTIIMASESLLREFHANYFRDNSAERKESAVGAAGLQIDKLIEQITSDSNEQHSVMRKISVPSIQFAVVGNSVYEFILDTVDGATEVRRAKVLRERTLCERFVETFRVLETLP